MLNGRRVRAAYLVELQFDQPRYLWNGFRTLEAGGRQWFGLRKLGSIEGLDEQEDGLQSTELRLAISGGDAAFLQLAISEERSTYVGKLVIVWIVFFDEDWQVIDEPFAFKAGIIDGIEVSRRQDGDRAIRTLSVTAQNIFYGRSTPPASNFSDLDQKYRYPGDRGLEQASDAVETVIQVPW
jgi:hypothetical protein